MSWHERITAAVTSRVDGGDMCFAFGLGLAAYGVSQWSIPAAWFFVGVVVMSVAVVRDLVAVAMSAARRKGARR